MTAAAAAAALNAVPVSEKGGSRAMRTPAARLPACAHTHPAGTADAGQPGIPHHGGPNTGAERQRQAPAAAGRLAACRPQLGSPTTRDAGGSRPGRHPPQTRHQAPGRGQAGTPACLPALLLRRAPRALQWCQAQAWAAAARATTASFLGGGGVEGLRAGAQRRRARALQIRKELLSLEEEVPWNAVDVSKWRAFRRPWQKKLRIAGKGWPALGAAPPPPPGAPAAAQLPKELATCTPAPAPGAPTTGTQPPPPRVHPPLQSCPRRWPPPCLSCTTRC